MTNDYIRRQAAIDALEAKKDKSAKGDIGCFYNTIIQNAIDALKGLTSADVVQVVRCKDCKYRDSDDFCVGRGFPYQLVAGDEFCSRAKTKEHMND